MARVAPVFEGLVLENVYQRWNQFFSNMEVNTTMFLHNDYTDIAVKRPNSVSYTVAFMRVPVEISQVEMWFAVTFGVLFFNITFVMMPSLEQVGVNNIGISYDRQWKHWKYGVKMSGTPKIPGRQAHEIAKGMAMILGMKEVHISDAATLPCLADEQVSIDDSSLLRLIGGVSTTLYESSGAEYIDLATANVVKAKANAYGARIDAETKLSVREDVKNYLARKHDDDTSYCAKMVGYTKEFFATLTKEEATAIKHLRWRV